MNEEVTLKHSTENALWTTNTMVLLLKCAFIPNLHK